MDPRNLFDISSFEHSALFEKASACEYVLNELLEYLMNNIAGTDAYFEGAYIQNPELLTLGNGVQIEPGVYIEGPCIIGDNTTVRHGAYIRGGALIGANCVVGHASEIKHAIMLNGAKAPHFNYVGDSILGNNVNLGAGAITANVRFDRKEIRATGRTKCGAFVGDETQVGCNVVLAPGAILQKGSEVLPAKASINVIDGLNQRDEMHARD